MKDESFDSLVHRLQGVVRSRMAELEPQVGEAVWLQRELVIVEYAINMRDELQAKLDAVKPAATRANVDTWAKSLDLDYIVKAADLAAVFGKYDTWARNHLNRLVEAGIMEKWGKGQYRRKPDRKGTAKLHVVSRGA